MFVSGRPLAGRFSLLLTGAFLAACGGVEPDGPVEPPAGPSNVWFSEIELPAGTHSALLDGSFPMPENLGPGVGLFDYDSDGDLDIYIIDGGDGSNPTPNRLLRQDLDGSFVDVTSAAGVGDPGYGLGIAIADIEGDGDVDIYLTNFGPDRLLRNNGDGSFSRAAALPAMEREDWTSSAAFCDVDGDGLADLFVTTYLHYDPTRTCTDRAGRREYCGPSVFPALPDLLLTNLGDGTFADTSIASGIQDISSRGLGVVCHDLDGDGLADIFVANDGEKNDLWINRGDGSFEEEAYLMGTAMNLLGKPESSMGIAIGDVDGDLDIDLLLSHLDRESNTLYRNLGAAGFQDATAGSGIGDLTLPYTGFGAVFFDPDLDGDLDLLLANGKVRRGSTPATDEIIARAREIGVPHLLHEYAEPNLLLENTDGRFVDGCGHAGSLCSHVEVARGLVVGDLDRSGTPDVVLANCAGPTRAFLNRGHDGGHWFAARAVRSTGSDVLGAEVRIEAGDRRQFRPLVSTYSYQSSAEPVAHFGLGDSTAVSSLMIDWPGDRSLRIEDLPADRFVTLYRSTEARP